MNLKYWTTPPVLEFLRMNEVMNVKTMKLFEYISTGIWMIPELVEKALSHAKLFLKSYFSLDFKDCRSFFSICASFISSVSPLLNTLKPSSFFLISDSAANSSFNFLIYGSKKFKYGIEGTISRFGSTKISFQNTVCLCSRWFLS